MLSGTTALFRVCLLCAGLPPLRSLNQRCAAGWSNCLWTCPACLKQPMAGVVVVAWLLDAGQGVHSRRTGSGGRLVLCCGCCCGCDDTCHPLNQQIRVIDYPQLCRRLGQSEPLCKGQRASSGKGDWTWVMQGRKGGPSWLFASLHASGGCCPSPRRLTAAVQEADSSPTAHSRLRHVRQACRG